MKIIHILSGKANPKQTQNGVNVVVDRYADLQFKMGYDVEVWGLAKNPYTNIPKPDYPIHLFQQHTNFPRLLDKKIFEAIGTIDTKNTVLHFHGAFMPEFFRVVSLLSDPVYFLMPHGLYSEYSLKRKKIRKYLYIKLFEKKLIKGSNGLIILHENELGTIIRQTSETTRCVVVPNGADYFDEIQTDNIKLSTAISSSDKTVWGYCGRIDNKHKAVNRIVRCFIKFASLHSDEKHILSIIGDGPDLDSLRREYSSETNAGLIQFHGKQFGKDKYNLLGKMDYFIHLSNFEGLPLACLDALRLGIPLLVTPATNLGDDVANFNAGLVTTPDDTSVISSMNKIISLDRALLVRGCVNLSREKFDWKVSCGKLINLYLEALMNRRDIVLHD